LGGGEGRDSQKASVKIEILEEAAVDLVDGFHFYQGRKPGLAGTFWIRSSPMSTLSLSTLEFTNRFTAISVASQNIFLLLCTIRLRKKLYAYMPFWTAVATHPGSERI